MKPDFTRRLVLLALFTAAVAVSPASAQAQTLPATRAEVQFALLHPEFTNQGKTPWSTELLKELPPDRWFAFDKVQHFAVSFLWVVGSQYTFVNKAGMTEGDALPLSVLSGAVAGVSKEVYDRHRTAGGHFCTRDLAADALGLLLAAGFTRL